MFKELMTECTKFVDLKSLEYLAAVRLAITICESEDVQCMIGRFRKYENCDGSVGFPDGQWRRLCGKVKRNLSQIRVPDLIIDIALENLWPISFEIFKWILYHFQEIGLDVASNFCWTPHVNIDYVKTAEILVRNEAIDIKKRYKLACLYCLDSEVRSLWEHMTLPEKRSFYSRGNLNQCTQHPIAHYWTYYIQELPIDYWDSKTLNPSQLLIYSVKNGCVSSVKFFLHQLKTNHRKRIVSNCFRIHLRRFLDRKRIVRELSVIAWVLVSEVPLNDREISLFGVQYFIFSYFLEWPMQRHFMAVVNRLRRYLNNWACVELLNGIFDKIVGDFKDYDYKELFMQFWHLCPDDTKGRVRTNSWTGYKILMRFVKKHFGFVFEESSMAMKTKFRAAVFQSETSENETYFDRGNVKFIKFLVLERVTIKDTIELLTNDPDYFFSFTKETREFYNLPLGELLYLIDGILDNVN